MTHEAPQSHETSLSPAQRRQMVAHTLFNAQLLLDGADFHPSGVLLLTDEQRANAAETGNPLVSGAEQQERAERATWLATPLRDVFHNGGVTKEQSGRMVASLRDGYGLFTIGNVLAYGRDSTDRAHGIGPNAMRALDAFIGGNTHGVVWQETPTMDDVAGICPTLADVPRVCLERYGVSQTGDVRVRWRGNIQELLAEDAIESDVWVRRGTPAETVTDAISGLRSAVDQFASDFALARQRVEYPDLVNRPQA